MYHILHFLLKNLWDFVQKMKPELKGKIIIILWCKIHDMHGSLVKDLKWNTFYTLNQENEKDSL